MPIPEESFLGQQLLLTKARTPFVATTLAFSRQASPHSSCRRSQRVPVAWCTYPIAVALNITDVCRTRPYLVSRQIEVMHNLATVEGIGASIGSHHSVEVSALLICHLFDRLRLGSSIIGDEK